MKEGIRTKVRSQTKERGFNHKNSNRIVSIECIFRSIGVSFHDHLCLLNSHVHLGVTLDIFCSTVRLYLVYSSMLSRFLVRAPLRLISFRG